MKLSSVLSVLLSLAVISQAAPMDKRRFGQEHTPEADATFQEVKDLAQGSDKEAQAGNLSGAMVRALLAKAPACDQQDRADEVIDLGKEFGGEKLQQYIKVAQTYRQLERNTPKDGQPSELCDKAPRNKELDGLTQAQDPTGKAEDPKAKDPEDPKAKDPEDPKAKDPEDPKAKDPEDPKAKDPEDPKAKDPKKPKKPKKPKADPEDPKAKDPEDPKAKDPEDPKAKDPEETNIAETDPVGGVKMPKIEQKDGDFIVNGNGFNGNVDNAHARQCDIQRNLCFNKFNAGDRSFSTEDCDTQANNCKAGPPVFA